MQEEAHLITTARLPAENQKVEKLLAFFGVSGRCVSAEEFYLQTQRVSVNSKSCRLFSSADGLLELLTAAQRGGNEARRWAEQIHSVFVHADSGEECMGRLLEVLTNEVNPPWKGNVSPRSAWTISSEVDGFGGGLAGLHVRPRERAQGPPFAADLSQIAAIPLISSGDKAVFFSLSWNGVPIYLCLFEKIVDVAAELTTPNFDIRDHFFSALPIVMYIRWAFPSSAWQAPEAGACLIIDDPLLRPRYGFIRFDELLRLMGLHNFTTNIAFIPWNWRRNDRRTVELFKQNSARYSLSIHGCDHTSAEFGTSDPEALRSKIGTATQRMTAHEQASGLRHEPIMVFPQGVFSEEAIRCLKQANVHAVVNTEVKCNGSAKKLVKISDVWETAVMLYGDFPIYTRRYPRQGIENFAFDLLLGKPCFIVIHHDHCIEHCEKMVEFIDQLNALKCRLTWRSPGEVVKHSYRRREVDAHVMEIQMYGAEIAIENPDANPRLFRIRKQESDLSALKEVRVGSELVSANFSDGFLRLDVTLQAGENTVVTLRFNDAVSARTNGHVPTSGLKTRLRRYLSEVRDYCAPRRNLASRLFPEENERNRESDN